MRKVLLTLVVICLTAAVGMAAGIRGSYVEARNADIYVAHCFANSELNLAGDLAVMAWRIDEGSWNNVALDGLGVAAVIKASGTLGDPFRTAYPTRAVLIVDQKANAEQRVALESFVARMAGDLVQTVVRVETAPLEFDFRGNLHAGAVKVTGGELFRIETRQLRDGDAVCHNAVVYYPPLTRLTHAMPAFTLDNRFAGAGLNTTWSSPNKNSAFLGTFEAASE